MNVDISIIIPAKNEEKRLPPFLESIHDYCKQSPLHHEIIVVDDGSSDATTAAALSYKGQFENLNVITLPVNHGKGYALKQGFLSSKGKIALFLDADGSTPVAEIQRHLHHFNEGYDIIIGSRVLKDKQSVVNAVFYRRLMGGIFNFLVHTFIIKDIKDTQCGFKMFRQEIIKPLWDKVHLEGFGFDLEVLYLAQRAGYKIKEVPVNWHHVDGSKIHLIKDSLRMLINIFEIKARHYLKTT